MFHHLAIAQDDTMYPIPENSQFGFINSQGEVVVEPKYEGAKISSEGLATVRPGCLWGIIGRIR